MKKIKNPKTSPSPKKRILDEEARRPTIVIGRQPTPWPEWPFEPKSRETLDDIASKISPEARRHLKCASIDSMIVLLTAIETKVFSVDQIANAITFVNFFTVRYPHLAAAFMIAYLVNEE